MIIKRYFKDSLSSDLNLGTRDSFSVAVKKVLGTFQRINPPLMRKVTFLDLIPTRERGLLMQHSQRATPGIRGGMNSPGRTPNGGKCRRWLGDRLGCSATPNQGTAVLDKCEEHPKGGEE